MVNLQFRQPGERFRSVTTASQQRPNVEMRLRDAMDAGATAGLAQSCQMRPKPMQHTNCKQHLFHHPSDGILLGSVDHNNGGI